MIKNTDFTKGFVDRNSSYRSDDGTAGFSEALKTVSGLGGKIAVPVGCHEIENTVKIDESAVYVDGEVWNYASDPNGVFEGKNGSKLRLKGQDHPAISVGISKSIGGVLISNIGIQGDIEGMDSRDLFDLSSPEKSAGILMAGSRVDQCEVSKVAFCGLSSAICATGTTFIDACRFDKLNFDGCCMGVYFAPKLSVYSTFSRCLVADTPSYGFFADATNTRIRYLTLSEMLFIRNCGSNVISEESAAAYLKNTEFCSVRNCTFDAAGVFWYYAPTDTKNGDRKPTKNPAVGLIVEGIQNTVTNNTFTHSSRESIKIYGNGNILVGNISDGDVIIEGEGNIIRDHIFTTPNARLILKGKAAETTDIMGIPESRIVKE